MSSSTRTARSAASGRPRKTGAAASSPATTSAPRAAQTVVPPPEPRPDLASITTFEDVRCVTQGILGVDTVLGASCVRTAHWAVCNESSQGELVFRLNSSVTTLPPEPGMQNCLDVLLLQAEGIRNESNSSFAIRNRLAFSEIAEYAVMGFMADGLLRQSNGCDILLAWPIKQGSPRRP